MESEKNEKVSMHEEICKYLTDLYARKNKDYDDSYAKSRRKRPDVIFVRIDDKVSRLENLYKKDVLSEVLDETIDDTLLDLANYCIMEVIERRIEKGMGNTLDPNILEISTLRERIREIESAVTYITEYLHRSGAST